MLWMETAIQALITKKKYLFYLVSTLLFIVSTGSFYLLWLVNQEFSNKKLTLIVSLFVFHVYVMDNIIWNYRWISTYILPKKYAKTWNLLNVY